MSKPVDYAALVKSAETFQFFPRADDFKMPDTAYYGGFECRDKELMNRIRSVGADLVKAAGKKILSGDFNLTTISFPIRACSAQSVLQRIPDLSKLYSFYLNYAAKSEDPVERMKAVIAGSIAGMY